MSESKAKAKVGRPPKIIEDDKTIAKIKQLALVQCTQAEAAARLGVSIRTFEEFLRASENAREAWDFGRENGKVSLRRRQWAAAKTKTPDGKPNNAMLIWLGKQWLGQKDKQEVEHDATKALIDLWTQIGEGKAAT